MAFMKEKSVAIEKLDGGYLLEWRDDTKDAEPTNSWPELPRPATSGKEIFTSKAAALKRAAEIL